MAQNYSKKSSARAQRNNQTQRPLLPIFIVGVVVGVAGSQLVPALLQNNSQIAIPGIKSDEESEITTPDFQFPNLLKGAEIKIPESNSTTAEDANASYFLQVGSFKDKSDAESLRVQLLLLNLQAFIEPFKTSSGDIWHRVLVGPFASNSESTATRTKLAENNHDSLLLKRDNSKNSQ